MASTGPISISSNISANDLVNKPVPLKTSASVPAINPKPYAATNTNTQTSAGIDCKKEAVARTMSCNNGCGDRLYAAKNDRKNAQNAAKTIATKLMYIVSKAG